MIRFLVLLLTFCVTYVAIIYAFDYLGFTLTTMTLTALLTLSYVLRYRQRGLGLGLAYWGLIYAAIPLRSVLQGYFFILDRRLMSSSNLARCCFSSPEAIASLTQLAA